MFNRVKFNIGIVVMGLLMLSLGNAGQVAAQSSCDSRDGCDVIIITHPFDCESLNGEWYMGSFWPQSRTANLKVGQKLSIRVGGPSHSYVDISINGSLVFDDVDSGSIVTVEYIVPANGTYTILFEAYNYDPGQNFLIRCGSSIDSYKTP